MSPNSSELLTPDSETDLDLVHAEGQHQPTDDRDAEDSSNSPDVGNNAEDDATEERHKQRSKGTDSGPSFGSAVTHLDDPSASAMTTDQLTDPGEKLESDDEILVPADGAAEAVKRRMQDFRILGQLGEGGMGQVFRVFDQRYNREVALKRLSNTAVNRLKLFKTEFRELADISHPNLATLYELLSDASNWYLTMELIEGVELGNYVMHGHKQVPVKQRRRRATEHEQFDRIREILPQLVRGLAALHSVGKYHRDIKENNVFVTFDGQIKLLDFGLVSNEETELREAANRGIQGTVPFIAPEQAAGRPTSAASDWYAVGVMVFHFLTGRWPFYGTSQEQLSKKRTQDAPTPLAICESVPRDLNDLCVRLMARDPQQRPTGEELREQFLNQRQTITLTGKRLLANTANVFVGRENESRTLDEAFNAVFAGRTKSIFIRGRSGYGKTTLARELLSSAEQLGAVVLSGRCFERESVPYKAWDNLIDSLAQYLSSLRSDEVAAILPESTAALLQVFPMLGRVKQLQNIVDYVPSSQQEIRRQAFASLRTILHRIGQRNPLVLYIDDLQWGDEDSAMLGIELLKPPNPPRLLLLATIRTEDADNSQFLNKLNLLVEQMIEAPEFESISVDKLSREESIRLADMLMPDYVTQREQRAEQIAEESDGNPMFIHELARAGQQIEVGQKRDAITSLDKILWKRILSLPDASKRLIELLAVQGTPINEHQAFVAAELETDGPNLLAQLRAELLVRSTRFANNELISVYHDRIRETIIKNIDANTKRRIHVCLGEQLEEACSIKTEALCRHLSELGTGNTLFAMKTSLTAATEEQRLFEIATHYDAAGDSRRALPFAFTAAQRGHAQFSLDAAEKQYRIAERGAVKADDSIRMMIAEGLGEVLMLKGQYDEALPHYEFALSLCQSPNTIARVKSKLAELHIKCGRPMQASVLSEAVLELSGRAIPENRVVLVLSVLKEISIQVLHTTFPKRFINQWAMLPVYDQMLLQTADPLSFSCLFTRNHLYAIWSHLLALNCAERGPESPSLAWSYSVHAVVCATLGLKRRQEKYAAKAMEIADRNQFLMAQGEVTMRTGLMSLMQGNIDECVERQRAALRIFLQTGDWFEINTARVILSAALYNKGCRSEAVDQSRRVWRTGVETGDFDIIVIAMSTWVIASRGQISKSLVVEVIERKRDDKIASGVAQLTAGVFEYFQGNLDRAIEHLDTSRQMLKSHGFEVALNVPVYAWRATVLRSQLQSMERNDSKFRRTLKAARIAVREAIKVSKTIAVERPHALRESAELALINGQRTKAMATFQLSLDCSDDLKMSYQSALTNLRMCELRAENNSDDAQADLVAAQKRLREFDIDDKE